MQRVKVAKTFTPLLAWCGYPSGVLLRTDVLAYFSDRTKPYITSVLLYFCTHILQIHRFCTASLNDRNEHVSGVNGLIYLELEVYDRILERSIPSENQHSAFQ